MSFHVGDRVRVNSHGTPLHGREGEISSIKSRVDFGLGKSHEIPNRYLELIPPTTEQLVEMFVKAGFEIEPISGFYCKDIGNVSVAVSVDGNQSALKVGYSAPWFMSADSAVKLALTLVEVCK
jgi:hypothetical protein